MRKTLLILLFLCILISNAFSLDTQTAITKADSLIAQKKYLSAFELLQENDPNNRVPEIVLKKSEIALNYFVTSIMHQVFALKNLSKDESIKDVRGKPGKYRMFHFAVNEVLKKLMESHPENWKLHNSLGEYYYEIHQKFCIHDSKEAEENLKLSVKYYQIARTNGVYDWKSLFVLGYFKLKQNKLDEAIPLFLESLDLNESYPSSNYNLAYAYLNKNKRQSALKYAIRAYELYDINYQKADAAMMVAIISEELGRNRDSLKFFKLADQYNPNNYRILKGIIPLLLEFNKLAESQEKSIALFNLDPTNPTVSNDLLSIYYHSNHQTRLFDVFDALEESNKNSDEILGNVYFHEGVFATWLNRYEHSVKMFKLAKNHLENVFPENHPVFKAIDEQLRESDQSHSENAE